MDVPQGQICTQALTQGQDLHSQVKPLHPSGHLWEPAWNPGEAVGTQMQWAETEKKEM